MKGYQSVDRGFSLLEITLALSLLLVVLGAVFQVLDPAHGAFRTEPERADLEQRLRVASRVMSDALMGVGAGVSYGAAAGPLNNHMATVLPYRLGRRNADAPGAYRADTITLLQTVRGAAQTTLMAPLVARSGTATIAIDPGCSLANTSCGFGAGMQVLIIGESGHFSLFSVTAVRDTLLTLQHDTRDSSYVFPAGSIIAEASSRTFYLKIDASNDLFQLARYDGDDGQDVPVVDHVVSLAFGYRGDPESPRPLADPSAPSGPWTTYGPRPPNLSTAISGYPLGENCVFGRDAAGVPVSRLPHLGGEALVDLTASQLTDGPWCPEASDPNRFDADLLRVRSVRLTLRVEVAAMSLRGSLRSLFARPGTAAGTRFVPDQEVTLDVSPENLDPGRAND